MPRVTKLDHSTEALVTKAFSGEVEIFATHIKAANDTEFARLKSAFEIDDADTSVEFVVDRGEFVIHTVVYHPPESKLLAIKLAKSIENK